MGNLEMARESADEAGQAMRENLDVALRGAAGLMNMINSLLDVSRLEEGKMPLELIDCDLNDLAGVASSSYAALAQRKKGALTVQGDAAPVKADPALVRRVFDNLVGNALKFTPAGGDITVTVTRSATESRAEVHDSGPNIPPEYFDKIFEKFGQMTANGKAIPHHSSGLGLTFCKLAVEAHGGKIGVTSPSGKGNCFWFSLPGEPALE